MAQSTSIKHKGWKWSTADASNPTLVMVLDNTSKAVHITDAADASTDWSVDAADHPTVYIHSATDPSTDYIKMYHNGTSGYFDVEGTTVFRSTASAIVVPLAITLGSTVALSDNITVATNKKLYFRDTNSYIHSQSASRLQIYAASKVFITGAAAGADDVVINSTLKCNDNVTMLDGKYIYLRGTECYIYSQSSNRMYIYATEKLYLAGGGSGADDVIVNSTLRVGDHLTMANDKYIYLRGTAAYIYADANNKIRIVSTATGSDDIIMGATVKMNDNVTMLTDKRIYFRDTNSSIYSGTANNIHLAATNIYLGASGLISCSGYVTLKITAVDGDTDGQIWYDDVSNKFQGRANGSTVDFH